MHEALIVFAKPPIAGRVKTRLHSLLTAREAAALYRAFLADSLEQYENLGRDVFLYLADTSELEMEGVDISNLVVRQQAEGDLGERLRRAFVEVFGLGYERVVVVGTDHPSLPSAFVERAFEELRPPLSIVVGPTEDGGYYLIGMNDFLPILFEGMRFSHGRVFEDTIDRASSTRASVSILPEWYDVDTADQLPRLWTDLRRIPEQAPRSARLLEELLARYDRIPEAL